MDAVAVADTYAAPGGGSGPASRRIMGNVHCRNQGRGGRGGGFLMLPLLVSGALVVMSMSGLAATAGAAGADGTPPTAQTAQNGGIEPGTLAFAIATSLLPVAVPRASFGPVPPAVTGVAPGDPGYTTTVTWGKGAVVAPAKALPAGLVLSSTGVLSGTPSPKLLSGTDEVTVKVTETITSHNIWGRPVPRSEPSRPRSRWRWRTPGRPACCPSPPGTASPARW